MAYTTGLSKANVAQAVCNAGRGAGYGAHASLRMDHSAVVLGFAWILLDHRTSQTVRYAYSRAVQEYKKVALKSFDKPIFVPLFQDSKGEFPRCFPAIFPLTVRTLRHTNNRNMCVLPCFRVLVFFFLTTYLIWYAFQESFSMRQRRPLHPQSLYQTGTNLVRNLCTQLM